MGKKLAKRSKRTRTVTEFGTVGAFWVNYLNARDLIRTSDRGYSEELLIEAVSAFLEEGPIENLTEADILHRYVRGWHENPATGAEGGFRVGPLGAHRREEASK